jgi:basic membrane protein A
MTVKDLVEKRPVGGVHVYGLENEGIAYSLDEYNKDLIPRSSIQTVEAAKKKIIAGEIKVTNAMEK